MPPKVAYLIAAHDQPASLARLVERLRHPQAKIFVHIDRKAAIAPFMERLTGGRDITILPDRDRHSVYWSGFSQVQASLALLRAAFADSPSFDRFCLLSGADYPLLSAAHLVEVLSSDIEYLRVDREIAGHGETPQDAFVRSRFFGDTMLLNDRTTKSDLLLRIAKFVGAHAKRKRPPGLRIFHGASWWALTGKAVSIVLEAAAADKRWDFFRQVQSADEFYFHSILKAHSDGLHFSDDAARQGGSNEPNLHGAHYIDWTQPAPDRPKTLNLSDFEAVRASSAFFARKMHWERSAALLDAIDGSMK